MQLSIATYSEFHPRSALSSLEGAFVAEELAAQLLSDRRKKHLCPSATIKAD